jgi:hypothetical protein
LEATPTKLWDANQRKLEAKRANNRGPAAYWNLWRSYVQDKELQIIEALKRYAKSISIFPGKVVDGSRAGSMALLPDVPPGRVRPVLARRRESYLCVPDPDDIGDGGSLARLGRGETISFSDRDVRRLPNVQPKTADVRNGGGDMDAKRDDRPRTTRLLVLPAAEGQCDDGKLLGEGK